MPDCTDLEVLLLAVREEPEELISRLGELERLDVAGATLLTEDDELPAD